MTYRQPEREQMKMFPSSIEEYISSDDPVRAYDVMVDAIGIEALGIEWEPEKVGCPQYDPLVMLKVLVYGYSYGIRSSRKLERALHHNLSFIWLAGGLKPDHKTIARFRRDNRDSLRNVMKRSARICMDMGLIEGNTLFVDGSKFRGNASLNNQWNTKRCERQMKRIDGRIDEILRECDTADERESDEGSWVRLKDELKNARALKSKVEGVLEKLQAEELTQYNSTDSEVGRMHSTHGSFAGYNAQIVVDDKHGLIVNSDVVSENNDLDQFASQIDQANEVLGKKCEIGCSDAGYSDADELERIDAQGIQVIVPSSRQASNKEVGAFDKSRFDYIADEDCYLCPEGIKLPFRRVSRKRRMREYYAGRGACRNCRHFGVCTNNRTTGRKIIRFENEEFRRKIAAQYDKPSSQAVFARRKEKAELPFAHIKRNLGADNFILRGLSGVRAEMSILSSCFNISRLIGLFGVSELVKLLLVLKRKPPGKSSTVHRGFEQTVM